MLRVRIKKLPRNQTADQQWGKQRGAAVMKSDEVTHLHRKYRTDALATCAAGHRNKLSQTCTIKVTQPHRPVLDEHTTTTHTHTHRWKK